MATDGQTTNGQAITILVVCLALSTLAILAVAGRFYARKVAGLKYHIDDYLAVAALVATLGVTANIIVGVVVAGIGDDEVFATSGAYKSFPLTKELKPQGEVMYALLLLHTCAIPLIKASVLLYYRRLFPLPGFKIAVSLVAIYSVLWWVSSIFVMIFECHPISANWRAYPIQVGKCIPHIGDFYKTAAISNVFGDVLVVTLPFPIVMRLPMPLQEKLAVLAVFVTGILTCVASIGRAVAFFTDSDNSSLNLSHWYYAVVIWTAVEPTLGLISACLPTLRPIYNNFSQASFVGSIRSVLSLHSSRCSRDSTLKKDVSFAEILFPGPVEGESTVIDRTPTSFPRLPEPSRGRMANQDATMRSSERSFNTNRIATTRIVVREHGGQRVVHGSDEMV